MTAAQEHGLRPRAREQGGTWRGHALPSLPSAQVSNLGQRDLPVTIHFLVPMELNQVAVWTELEILHPQVSGTVRGSPTDALRLGFLCPSPSLMSPPRRLLSVSS